MRRSRTSSPRTGRSSGSSTGERSSSAGGWVSPRPISSAPPTKRRTPTTRTPTTKTRKPSTRGSWRSSGVDRAAGGGRHRAHATARSAVLLPRRVGLLDDRDDLVDLGGEPEQLHVVGRDRRGLDERRPDPREQAAPVLGAEEEHREAGDL